MTLQSLSPKAFGYNLLYWCERHPYISFTLKFVHTINPRVLAEPQEGFKILRRTKEFFLPNLDTTRVEFFKWIMQTTSCSASSQCQRSWVHSCPTDTRVSHGGEWIQDPWHREDTCSVIWIQFVQTTTILGLGWGHNRVFKMIFYQKLLLLRRTRDLTVWKIFFINFTFHV